MRKLGKQILSLGLLAAWGTGFSQVEMTEGQYQPYGVTNDGVVVMGGEGWNGPFYLWTPEEDDIFMIGGVTAGNGIGGVARFTDDGRKVAAVMMDSILLPLRWDTIALPGIMAAEDSIILTDMLFYMQNEVGILVGKRPLQDTMIIMTTMNEGRSWLDLLGTGAFLNLEGKDLGGFNVAALADPYNVVAGGDKGTLYFGRLTGGMWNPVDNLPAMEVGSYTALDFMVENTYALYPGLVGGTRADGNPFLWRTTDGGNNFDTLMEGLGGIPTDICHVGSAFFMTTENGLIQKSVDTGSHWTTVCTADEGLALNQIAFDSTGKYGLALSTGCVYASQDSGNTWTRKTVAEGGIWSKAGKTTENVVWNDLLWTGSTAIVAGSDGQLWQSTGSNCDFWSPMENPMGEKDILTLCLTDKNGYLLVAGEGGTVYRKLLSEQPVKEYRALSGIYDIATDTWSSLPYLPYYTDMSCNNTYMISGDGSTVVGSMSVMEPWTDGTMRVQSRGMAIRNGEVINLGTRFLGEYTRANAVSYDGSVIVGHQDMLGPWMAAVWTMNGDSTYGRNQFLLAEGGLSDEAGDWDFSYIKENIVGQAQAVSSDGKWIGGVGNSVTAFSAPWLFNREKGEFILLAEGDFVEGCVSDMNNDATVVVGWNGNGESGWIWTPQDGQMELNDFVTEKLGVDLGDGYLASVYDMSPNGRWIVGYGIRGMEHFGYRIDLKDWLDAANEESGRIEAAVYPNPVSTELHVDLLDESPAMMRLYDLSGRLVMERQTRSASNVLNVEGLESGMYLLQVTLGGKSRAFKVSVVR